MLMLPQQPSIDSGVYIEKAKDGAKPTG